MAEGILGLGSSGSQGLNSELIEKLKKAEGKAFIDPYEKSIENWDKELELMDKINSKVNEFLEVMKRFDLYKSGSNAFEQVSASTSGTSALFDAIDVSGLEEGTNSVSVTQLAQKDVYQSNLFTNPSVQVLGGNDASDKMSITIAGTTYDFSTEGKTYTQLAKDINDNENFVATVEEVGTNEFRLVIKSAKTGTDNALTIDSTLTDIGFTSVLSAQNMQANVDGVNYDVSSNTITIQGNLKMTAFELGTSTISITKDNSAILPSLKEMAEKYNELVDMIDEELFSGDSVIENPGTLRSMLSHIKNSLFASYGTNDDLNVFNFGFSLDKTGHLLIDEEILGKALTDNLDSIKELFLGVAEKPGLGTSLKEYLDGLDGFEGLLTQYGEAMISKKANLDEDKEKAQEVLDSKYTQMSLQFAAYTAIITQMEAAFGGMKMMMEQSTSR